MLTALLGAALAHQPHAVLVDVARAPDGSMLGILDPHDTSQLVTSDDGRHFAFTGGVAADEDLTAAAFVDDGAGGTWVVGDANGGVWTSPDRRAWTRALTLDGAITALDGGPSLLAATKRGLVTVALAGTPEGAVEAADVAFVDAAWGGTARVAVAADGRVWSGRAGTALTALAALPDDVRALSAALSGAPYAGTNRGVYRYDVGAGSWSACGPVPATGTTPDDHAVHLLVADPDAGLLLAATGTQALFASADGCATWQRWDTGDAVVIGGIGYASDAASGFVWADVDGDTVQVAGFDGLAVSDDRGGTFAHPDLLPADYSRGIARGGRRGDVLYQGGYAGGVAFTDDGATWDSSGTGLTGLHGNGLATGPGDDEVWHATDLVTHRSTDGGRTWDALDVPIERQREIRVLADGVWVLGGDEHGDDPGSRIAVTDDGGATWTLDADYAEVAGENAILDLFDAAVNGEDLRVAVLQKPAGLLVRRTGQWAASPTFEGFAAGAAAWPPVDATRLVLAVTTGVWVSDDGGATFVPASSPPGGHPRELFADDGGRLVIVDRGGRTWASDDGGDTWVDAGVGLLPAAIHDATAMSGGFAVAATTTGPWWTDDPTEGWHPAPRHQRLEAEGFHVACTAADGEACAPYVDASAGAGGGVLVPPGGQAVFSCVADAVRVVSPAPDAITVTATVAGAWQDVVLTTDAAEGARLDAVICEAAGEPIPLPRTCGCASGTGNSAGILVAAGLVAAVSAPLGGARRRRCGVGSGGRERSERPSGNHMPGST